MRDLSDLQASLFICIMRSAIISSVMPYINAFLKGSTFLPISWRCAQNRWNFKLFGVECMLQKSFGFFVALLFAMPALSANLLFQSGFESDVAISSISHPKNSTTSFQGITGSDVPGYSWPIQIRTSSKANFHHIINAGGSPPTPPVPDLKQKICR